MFSVLCEINILFSLAICGLKIKGKLPPRTAHNYVGDRLRRNRPIRCHEIWWVRGKQGKLITKQVAADGRTVLSWTSPPLAWQFIVLLDSVLEYLYPLLLHSGMTLFGWYAGKFGCNFTKLAPLSLVATPVRKDRVRAVIFSSVKVSSVR